MKIQYRRFGGEIPVPLKIRILSMGKPSQPQVEERFKQNNSFQVHVVLETPRKENTLDRVPSNK